MSAVIRVPLSTTSQSYTFMFDCINTYAPGSHYIEYPNMIVENYIETMVFIL